MITAHPNNIEGKVEKLDVYVPSLFVPPSAILCRNTAPLVSFAYGLLHRDIPCRIAGKDIGAQLAALVQKMRAKDLSELRIRLGEWCSRETARAFAEDRSPEAVEDKVKCLYFFIDGLDEESQRVADLLSKIDLLFSDNGSDSKIVLSTIHRAKGLEWPLVFLLDWSLLPSRYAKQPWAKEQETNLQYVAITRSQDRLVYIQSDCWKEEINK